MNDDRAGKIQTPNIVIDMIFSLKFACFVSSLLLLTQNAIRIDIEKKSGQWRAFRPNKKYSKFANSGDPRKCKHKKQRMFPNMFKIFFRKLSKILT